MEVLYLLVPLSIVLAILIAAAFLWAANSGQFDDIERHGSDILHDDEPEAASGDLSAECIEHD